MPVSGPVSGRHRWEPGSSARSSDPVPGAMRAGCRAQLTRPRGAPMRGPRVASGGGGGPANRNEKALWGQMEDGVGRVLDGGACTRPLWPGNK